MNWIWAALTLFYLAGIVAFAAAWPPAIRQHPWLQDLADDMPIAVCLFFAILTVAWPVVPLAVAIKHFTRRTR
ncbi:hypothetical protein ACFWV1_26190 [Streptomyces sp. NPDC058700]|uniref:hypothetical protein n=1 Tax=Streptomyces sp. NPDC058700 TaxID=3346607 RepID=UPI003655DC8F